MTTAPSDRLGSDRGLLDRPQCHSRTMLMAYRLDPFNSASWSGTTKHLADRLGDLGWRVRGDPLEVTPTVVTAMRKAYRRLRLGPDVIRNPILRRWRSQILRHQLRRSDAAVVFHVGTLHLPLPERWRDRRQHIMFIDTTWSSWARHRVDLHRGPGWLRHMADNDERLAYSRMDHIFTASQCARQSLLIDYDIDPGRVTAVGTGLGQRLPPVERPPPGRAPRLLFVGKHRTYDKGLDVALEALSIVRRDREDATLTIVGSLPPKTATPPGVDLRRWVEPDELARLYAAADLFVLPARNEPWGLVYLEALSQGTPILGVDRHAFREIAGDGAFGVIVDEPDPHKVADGVLRALEDRSALAEMGAAGQRHVATQANWTRVATAITETLERD